MNSVEEKKVCKTQMEKGWIRGKGMGIKNLNCREISSGLALLCRRQIDRNSCGAKQVASLTVEIQSSKSSRQSELTSTPRWSTVCTIFYYHSA